MSPSSGGVDCSFPPEEQPAMPAATATLPATNARRVNRVIPYGGRRRYITPLSSQYRNAICRRYCSWAMNLQDMRVVVAGGAGFIGSHLVDRLVADNDVLVVDDGSNGKGEWVHDDAEF